MSTERRGSLGEHHSQHYLPAHFFILTLHDVNHFYFFRIAREAGVERLIHLSSLNVEANPKDLYVKGGSEWLKSKYEGELRVRDAFPNATIIRPADIYGSEDRFLRYYAHIWRRQFRSMPLWHKGEKTVKQPVYVSDVAQAIINAAKDPDSAGRIYQAVG